jgi:UDP-N-acetylmuramoyl-tripeptide--D-alanyl-D-alanine ligase
MKLSLSTLQTVLSSSTMTEDMVTSDVEIQGISTDSRKVEKGNLFVALRGEYFDAHHFIKDVIQLGASAVVVDALPKDCDIPALIVPDTKLALAEIAQYWRRQHNIPVIAVTGSNGKTTVKEMIASILTAHFGADHIVATKGNLNNEIGVPLTLFRLNAHHQAAVIELGMNHQGEIAVLSAIAQATVGLVNNAQREHQEFMQTVQAVAEENGAVIRGLPTNGIAVFPCDDIYSELWASYAKESGDRKIVTFGTSSNADVCGSFEHQLFGCNLTIHIGEDNISFPLNAAGKHNVLNALAAAACCWSIGIPLQSIAHGLTLFQPVSGRLQLKKAMNGASVIDDTYNANPDSVIAAIDVLQNTGTQSVLVLGDMGEVGEDGAQFHTEIGTYALQQGIKKVYTLGNLAQFTAKAFGENAQHFSDMNDLQNAICQTITEENTVLIKGSRFMKMERVVNFLVNQLGFPQQVSISNQNQNEDQEQQKIITGDQ